jgi:cation diffusion facilitator family transporter
MPQRVLFISTATNVFLTLLKVGGGMLTGSSGLLADGFHSLTDVIAMTVNYFGVRTSLRPANGLEAYDNYRKEITGIFIVSLILFVIGSGILVQNFIKLVAGISHAPGLAAGLIIFVAFAITCRLYSYTKREMKQFDSPGMTVNTEQIRLNILSTVAVFVGILGSLIGMKYLDAVAAIVVAIIIIYSAIDIIRKFHQETRAAQLTKAQIRAIKEQVARTDERLQVVRIKSMPIRKKVWVLLELARTTKSSPSVEMILTLKTNLLSELLSVDNVIIDLARGEAGQAAKIEVEDFRLELGWARNLLAVVLGMTFAVVMTFSAFGLSLYAREYTILIPADTRSLEGQVSRQLGRAPYFYIYRTDRKKGMFISNRLAVADPDIDHKTAKLFRDYCIEAVIVSNIGPYLFEHLQANGTALYEAEAGSSLARQLALYKESRLPTMTAPNVNVQFGLENYRFLEPWYDWRQQNP